MRKLLILFLTMVSGLLLAAQCAATESQVETQARPETAASEDSGLLEFRANGEDFVRQGFVSKDGWNISFDYVYVNLAGITAYQTEPPYDPDGDSDLEAEVTAALDGTYFVDLAEGDERAETIFVDDLTAPAGQYNALSWQMVPAVAGAAEGYSMVMIGAAEKEGETIAFTIGVENSYNNVCGEFIGDERKGILAANGTADLEMTFHFDHIFGDAALPPDDGLNKAALGFEPFAAMAENGLVETDLTELEQRLPGDDYQMLVDILPTLGHTGEGHCFYGIE